MKKLYISIPITGYPIEAVKARANELKEKLSIEGWEVITPFDVAPDEEIAHIPDPKERYAYCMGKDIEALLLCDAVYFAQNWKKSKGCLTEKALALIYNKLRIYETMEHELNIILLKEALA